MEIRKQLVKRNIAGDVILVPIGDASLELKGLVTLNETGELLWDRLPQAADAADLAAALRAEYDVDEPTALQDAQAFLDALRQLLVDHGWTWLTAVCTMLFSLMHWPCSTTCLTIGKETKSAKWTLLSIAIPTGIGMAVCFLVASAARLLGLA
mgnify:CR=1 FL=1